MLVRPASSPCSAAPPRHAAPARAFMNPLFHVAVVVFAAAYQVTNFGQIMMPLSGLPVLIAGVSLYALTHMCGSPILAAKAGCFSLVLVLIQRCCVTFLAPDRILKEQLRFFEHPFLHVHVLVWACLGAGLRLHPHLLYKQKVLTFWMVSATYLLRMAVWFSRTGNSAGILYTCLLYTSPSPRDRTRSRMPSSA